MKILFVHQNFPGQYRHVAAALAQTPGWEVMALGDVKNIKQRPAIPGVKLAGYPTPQGATPRTHHYVTPLEGAVRRGQAVAKACLELKKRGFTPDLIHAHPGWGESLFIKDIFPDAHVTLYCEFFYRAQGSDVGFDPEYPSSFDDQFRVRVKNSTHLLSLEGSDAGISPTQWQKKQFPREYQERITVIHEGVDTEVVKPDPKAEVALTRAGLKLTPDDEVITYVARNLEPYRGFHIFMRSLPEILRRRPKAHVIIVGADGVSYGQSLPDKQTYKKKLLEELDGKLDAQRVHFLGQVPYAGLVRIYQVSSVHVYLTYPFVLSWSLLEAMSSGALIVGSRTPPLEEVVTDGKNGFLTDFFDINALAERVDQTLERRDELKKVRERARKTVVENYDLKKICLPKQLKLLGVKQQKKKS